MKNFYLFILLSLNSFAQTVLPEDVVGLCSGQSVVVSNPTSTLYNNLRAHCSTTPLTNTLVLYYVQIESGTTFTFEVTPQANIDYDFASWLNPNFSNLGPADRGSQNDPTMVGVYAVGLSMLEPTQTCEVPGASLPFETGVVPGLVRYYDVEPGDGILIAINRWTTTDAGFEITFGGDAVLDCDVDPRLYEKCDLNHDGKETFDLLEISEEINNVNNAFTIDFFEDRADAMDMNATNVLQSPYEVDVDDSPAFIYARFLRANGVYAKTIDIELVVTRTPKQPEEPLKYEICDYDGDRKEVFNLRKFESALSDLNGVDTGFKYYISIEDAEAELERKEEDEEVLNYIEGPDSYESESGIIYIVADIDGKCKAIIPLELKVNTMPVVSSKIIYSDLCGVENSKELNNTYNLLDFLPEVLSPVKDIKSYDISFYLSESDVDANNSIEDPSQFKIPFGENVKIIIRIQNSAGCYVFSTIELFSVARLHFEDKVVANCSQYILPELPLGYGYYTEPNGKGSEIIVGSEAAVIYGFKTIYVYAYKNNIVNDKEVLSECSYEAKFEIKIVDCEIPKGISPNGDGLNDFWDLRAFEVYDLKIYNRYGREVFSYGKGYTIQWMGQSTNGKLLPDGTYWFVFNSFGGRKEGWVQINR